MEAKPSIMSPNETKHLYNILSVRNNGMGRGQSLLVLSYTPVQSYSVVYRTSVRFYDFFGVSSTSFRLLMDAWACPRTLAPSEGRGNRNSMLTRLSKVGGTGTSRTSC